MTDRMHLTLRVELDSQDGSIAGQVLDGAVAGRSFSGWIGLAAAIEDALPGHGGRSTELAGRRVAERSSAACMRNGSEET